VAKQLNCDISQVQLAEDTAGDGFEATIVTEDPRAPGRAADMFKRWEKANAKQVSDPKAN
jgi:hypothetical protein